MTPIVDHDLDHVVERTRALREDLSDARLLITGGTGFFGRWLLESFCRMNRRLELHAEAVVLMRERSSFHFPWPEASEEACLRVHRGDIRSFAFPEGRFTHVIHAAGSGSPGLDGLSALETFDTIVAGTRHVLEFARARRVQKVLLVSSGAVYGRQPLNIPNLPETYSGAPDLGDPRLGYAEGKRVAELLSFYYAEDFGIAVKIARCFGFMGPFIPLDRGFALGNFIRDCLLRRPIAIQGDGTNHRSYLYAADLAVWLWTILVKGRTGVPYNVGSEDSHSVLEIAQTVRGAFQLPELPIQIAQVPRPGANPDRYAPSTDRAQTELGLEAWIGFATGIQRTVDFYRQCEPGSLGIG